MFTLLLFLELCVSSVYVLFLFISNILEYYSIGIIYEENI